jgi:hypothetical protein
LHGLQNSVNSEGQETDAIAPAPENARKKKFQGVVDRNIKYQRPSPPNIVRVFFIIEVRGAASNSALATPSYGF